MDGKEILGLRTKLGLSQEKFGKLFRPALSKDLISRLENGRRNPTTRQHSHLIYLFAAADEDTREGDATSAPKRPTTPSTEGWLAYGRLNLDQCPYALPTIERRQWFAGWFLQAAKHMAKVAR